MNRGSWARAFCRLTSTGAKLPAVAGAIGVTTFRGPDAPARAEMSESQRSEPSQPSQPHQPSQPGARLTALHTLLLDLARVPEARCATCGTVPALLEDFWHELVSSNVRAEQKELLLHRIADSYSHGTMRLEHAETLASRLKQLGVQSVLDPMAHTGFHAHLLQNAGLHVEASDASPSPLCCWRSVIPRTAGETPWQRYRDGWSLLLSWVPHWSEVGMETLQNFQGDVLIILGDAGPWTGTDGFREELHRSWVLLEDWCTQTPWPRVTERLQVFTRKKPRCS
eukprot:gb/GFBE01000945.1/.p1 GENE.gb/GFBE01000945.1/~~gb/GFBE01000945.1/.p1  ORF type:complete len:282 (+),score=24.79 gb/GFBE01000945.1/:1-846(+)